MADKFPSIGELRHPITIVKITQSPASDGTLTETLTTIAQTRAKIEQPGPIVMLNQIQLGINVYSHKFSFRYVANIDLQCGITRTIRLPNGSTITENYKINRIMDIEQLHRFLVVETTLESQ